MTDRPIIFSGPMVRALLAGTKTQTRRLLRVPAYLDADAGYPDPGIGAGGYLKAPERDEPAIVHRAYPPAEIGDRLWVRETWAVGMCAEGLAPAELSPGFWRHDNGGCWYRAGGEPAHAISPRGKWRPAIHMPRWASRLTLTVTNVRVERLQDISETDAEAEGIEPNQDGRLRVVGWRNYQDDASVFDDKRQSFRSLWDSINGDRPGAAWADNPWIYAPTFTVARHNIAAAPSAAATSEAA